MWSYFKGGKTSWESSYFGGVKRVLSEYPLYYLNYNIYVKVPEFSNAALDLSVYQRDKLINILFNEVFKTKELKDEFIYNLSDKATKIVNNPELLEKHTVRAAYGLPKLAVPLDKAVILSYVNRMRDTELGTLFQEYGPDLYHEDSEITIHVDIPEQKNSKNDSEASGKPKDESEDEENDKSEESFVNKKLEKQFIKFTNTYKDKDSLENFRVAVKNVERDSIRTVNVKPEEIVFAKKMYNLLDIVQDPKQDVVKNLLQGAMDSEKLAEVLAGNNRIHMRREENQSVKPFKVVVLGDYSGSMSGGTANKFHFQKKMLRSFFYLFNDLLKIEDLEFYGHSGGESPVLYRFHSPEYPYFNETFNTDIALNENYDGPIIEHIHKMVRAKSDKAVLFISLSDGQPSGENYGGKKAIDTMKQIMEKIKRDNFVTVGIGMLYMHTEGLYQYSVTLDDLKKATTISQTINRAVKENLVIEE